MTVDDDYQPMRVTEITLRPRYEHAGARLRLGIRGLTSLAEEALVNWFRARRLGPSVLAERYGLEFSIVDCASVCSGVVSVDDEVVASAQPVGVRHFTVRLAVRDGDAERVPLRSRVTLLLVRRAGRFDDPPDELAGMLVDGLETPDLEERTEAGASGWQRSGRVPMESCHHAGRMPHSAHLRVLTEVAETFAEDRGLPARRLLDEHGLVAIVPRVRIRLLADACAGDVLHTRYEVHQVLGRNLFDCRFDASVERGGRLTAVAAGVLLQGFAHVDDPAGRPAELSPEMVERMTAGPTARVT
jgi:acyl-CoA thioesterase FadM